MIEYFEKRRRLADVYRVDVEHGWVREVWLAPLDSELFDRICSALS